MDPDWQPALARLSEQIRGCYLDPEKGRRVAEHLDRLVAQGAYRGIGDEPALAVAVTEDLQSVLPDPHLYLAHTPVLLPDTADDVLPSPPVDPDAVRRDGNGVTAVRRLPGNVGLLALHRFHDVDLIGDVVSCAASLVADTDALLIDVRENTGGEPETVALLCSYLFDVPTQLNSVVFPGEGRTLEFWSSAAVPGRRYGSRKPVWLLTSRKTFSAAEGLAYDLAERERAVLVGETTRGGANFHFPRKVTDHLMSAVPSGQPVNPVSGDNWEGTGVAPHVSVPVEAAFGEAYRRALLHVTQQSEIPTRVRDEAAAALSQRDAALVEQVDGQGG